VAFVKPLRGHDEVMHAEFRQPPMQTVAERPSLVTTVDRNREGALAARPVEKLGGGKLLRRLRVLAVHLPNDHIEVGVHINAELDWDCLAGRNLFPSVVGVVVLCCVFIWSGVAYSPLTRPAHHGIYLKRRQPIPVDATPLAFHNPRRNEVKRHGRLWG